MKFFSENLKMFMDRYGISNTELAKRVGVSEVAVSRWKNGDRNPRAGIVEQLCSIFNCSYNDLMGPNSAEIQLDKEAYTEVLKLLEGLNTEGIQEVINFIGNLNDRFLR